MLHSPSSRPQGITFLLAELGQHAAERYVARLAELDLVAPQAAILIAVGTNPGRSQQAMSEQLGLLPSRVVAFIDDLERRDLVHRARNAGDRRLYALHLTNSWEELLRSIDAVAKNLDVELTAGLDGKQQLQLRELLTLLMAQHGLLRWETEPQPYGPLEGARRHS
jgi:DNA-binding MarR family transcriptional regulator